MGYKETKGHFWLSQQRIGPPQDGRSFTKKYFSPVYYTQKRGISCYRKELNNPRAAEAAAVAWPLPLKSCRGDSAWPSCRRLCRCSPCVFLSLFVLRAGMQINWHQLVVIEICGLSWRNTKEDPHWRCKRRTEQRQTCKLRLRLRHIFRPLSFDSVEVVVGRRQDYYLYYFPFLSPSLSLFFRQILPTHTIPFPLFENKRGVHNTGSTSVWS